MHVLIAPLAGLAAGVLHVLTGPDHLAAVTPLAIEQRERPWRAGLQWGLGHTGGVWLVGLLALALRGLLPVETMSGWAERSVGIALLVIGAWGLYRASARTVHSHPHDHGAGPHEHAHVAWKRHGHRSERASLAMGVLHGLAGSAHFLGIVPALALPLLAGGIYLGMFGVGAIAAMAAYAAAIGFTTSRLAERGPALVRIAMGTCSALAMVLGGWWLIGPV